MGRGARARRIVKRANAGIHTLERLLYGLTMKVRNAKAGLGGAATWPPGLLQEKLAGWDAELDKLLQLQEE